MYMSPVLNSETFNVRYAIIEHPKHVPANFMQSLITA
jgi:hypothetical protein